MTATGIMKTPDTIDELFDMWAADGGEKFRITLLHKQNGTAYCFLSEGVEEIADGKKIDLGMTLTARPKNSNTKALHDIVFKKHGINDNNFIDSDKGNFYFTMAYKDRKAHEDLLPFRFSDDELPSVVASEGLQNKLYRWMELRQKMILEGMEHYAEHSLLRSWWWNKHDPERKQLRQELGEVNRSINGQIVELFDDVSSPSVLMPKVQVQDDDKNKPVHFVKKRRSPLNLVKGVVSVPFVLAAAGIMPYSVIMNEILKTEIVKPYETRFGLSSEEEAKRDMGEIMMGHPRVVKGMQKSVELLKHAGNCFCLGLLGAAAYAMGDVPVAGTALEVWTALSAVAMAGNLALSKGHNSSGFASTLFDRVMYPYRLE